VERLSWQKFVDHDEQNWNRERDRPAQTSRHVVELFVRLLVERDVHGFERHPADRARAGTCLPNFGVHRAGVFRLRIGGYLAACCSNADERFGVCFEAVEATLVAEVVRVAPVFDLADRIGRRDRHAADRIENVRFYRLRHLLDVLLRVGVEFALADFRAEIIRFAVVLTRRRGLRRIHVHSTHDVAFHHGLQSTITPAPPEQRKCGISDALDETWGSHTKRVSDGVADGCRRFSSVLLVDGARGPSSSQSRELDERQSGE
jgi:hypothetical protein